MKKRSQPVLFSRNVSILKPRNTAASRNSNNSTISNKLNESIENIKNSCQKLRINLEIGETESPKNIQQINARKIDPRRQNIKNTLQKYNSQMKKLSNRRQKQVTINLDSRDPSESSPDSSKVGLPSDSSEKDKSLIRIRKTSGKQVYNSIRKIKLKQKPVIQTESQRELNFKKDENRRVWNDSPTRPSTAIL